MPLQLEPLPSARLIGPRILAFDRVDSTNTLAAEYAADPANDGLVIVAEEQTAGRGRRGRRWLSPPGSGILLSVLLFPPENLRRASVLTALASVAVCETIYACTRLQAAIKWPNDVLVRGKKVCGILVEQGRGSVIGIGLNVSTPAETFTAAQLPQAACLQMFTEDPLDRRSIARTLIQQLDAGYHELLGGMTGELESRWRWHSGLMGKKVTLRTPQGTHQGRLLDMNLSALLLEEATGQLRRLDPETVEEIAPA